MMRRTSLGLALLACAGAATAARVQALPAFHMAPAQLDEPADIDAGGTNLSARMGPTVFRIDPALAALSTARLTPSALAGRLRARAASARPEGGSGFSAAVYTPAQIRAAYGLPALPAVGASLSADAAAALGAGQTIYLVDADHNPNALADLNRFSTKFGLPACNSAAVTAVPLGAAGASCSFAQVYTDARSGLLGSPPPYDAGWASEIALDVQWAHAIAPLARLVLIEVASAGSNDLQGGIALANQMGPGVVSMSFGAPEGSWISAVDSTFKVSAMTYLAAAGDGGAGVSWPAASANVLAVGATSLAWSGSGSRREAVWSSTGGGVSAVTALPSWQAGLQLAGGVPAHRVVSDVSFNGDPTTGEYVAVTPPGSSSTQWNAYGGTSLSTPQWAGLIAVANAQRALASLAPLGDVHTLLYRTIGTVPGSYAAAFADIVSGSNGACADCSAGSGYDAPSGLGTPNAAGLLPLLVGNGGAGAAPTAPVVPGGSFSAVAGVPFAQTLGVVAPAGVTTSYAVTGAPTGLGVGTGLLKWAAPVAGSYSVTVTARTSAGASASAVYQLTVSADHAPVLAGASLTASTATAFSAAISGTDPNGFALTYTLAGGPSGLALSSSGALSWSKPVKGSYSFKITAHDPYGMTATASFTLSVTAAAVAPAVASVAVIASSGGSLHFAVPVKDASGAALSMTLAGAPAGMSIAPTGVVSWASPQPGSYTMTVVATDTSTGLSGMGLLTVTIRH